MRFISVSLMALLYTGIVVLFLPGIAILLWSLNRILKVFQTIKLIWFYGLCILLSFIGANWLISWQKSILPDYINTKILSPVTEASVSFRETIRVSGNPGPERIYILVHPHATQFWYVQDIYEIDKSQVPQNQINTQDLIAYFGVENNNQDCGQKFDLVVLASRDTIWQDLLRGRILKSGDMINIFTGKVHRPFFLDDSYYFLAGDMPVLNRSNQIVVIKTCPL